MQGIQIDEMLSKQCFFCGGLYIDMIDNDIKVLNTQRLAQFQDPEGDILEERATQFNMEEQNAPNDWLMD